ncbi:MAG: hypothetical protein ACO1OF_19000 [Adhaeribacter sp.]
METSLSDLVLNGSLRKESYILNKNKGCSYQHPLFLLLAIVNSFGPQGTIAVLLAVNFLPVM